MKKVIGYVERSIKAGKHAKSIDLALGAGAAATSILRARKLNRLILQGRIMAAERVGKVERAEELLVAYARRYPPTYAMIRNMHRRALRMSPSSGTRKLLECHLLHPDLKSLLQSAILRSEGKLEEALNALEGTFKTFQTRRQCAIERRGIYYQLQNHAALASSSLDFLDSEPKRIIIDMAINAARSAETALREDLFIRAINRAISDIDAVRLNKKLLRKHWREAVVGSLAVFDVAGAISIARLAIAHGIKAKSFLTQALELKASLDHIAHVIDEARRNILERAGRQKPISRHGEVTLIVPSAMMRSNVIDYPGFRSDIRIALENVVQTLEAEGVPYMVRSQIHTHSEIDLNQPYFSYHTVSGNTRGLHFKETDRRSLFSFDDRGYAGWSSFSELNEERLGKVSQTEADGFFADDKISMTTQRLSKYVQPETTEALPEKFVFVGLQVIGDSVQSLAYATPFEMMEEVIKTCEAKGIAVVVKRHPACKSSEIKAYLNEQAEAGRITVTNGNIHDIIASSLAVCVVNSGVGAEALTYEKPVYVFGRADYMSACFVCEHRGDFERQFEVGKSKLSNADLHKFWYLYRKDYSIDLTNPDNTKSWIANRVKRHLIEHSIPVDRQTA